MKWYRNWKTRRILRNVHRALAALDVTMRSSGMTRHERKRVWESIKSGNLDLRDVF